MEIVCIIIFLVLFLIYSFLEKFAPVVRNIIMIVTTVLSVIFIVYLAVLEFQNNEYFSWILKIGGALVASVIFTLISDLFPKAGRKQFRDERRKSVPFWMDSLLFFNIIVVVIMAVMQFG